MPFGYSQQRRRKGGWMHSCSRLEEQIQHAGFGLPEGGWKPRCSQQLPSTQVGARAAPGVMLNLTKPFLLKVPAARVVRLENTQNIRRKG